MKPFNNITEKVRERISHSLSKQVASITSCLPGMRGTEDIRLHPKLTGTLTPPVKGSLGQQLALNGCWILMGAGFEWVLAFLIARSGLEGCALERCGEKGCRGLGAACDGKDRASVDEFGHSHGQCRHRISKHVTSMVTFAG